MFHPAPAPSLRRRRPSVPTRHGMLLLGLALLVGAPAQASTAAEQLAAYSAQAGAAPSPARGQQFFNSPQGRTWSCASCHGSSPTSAGRHASTGKSIAPLAPAFQPDRFSDSAKTEKWFRRNCNDVVGRECSAGEKADVLAWLLTLKP